MKCIRHGLIASLVLGWALGSAVASSTLAAEPQAAKQPAPDAAREAKFAERLRLWQATETLSREHKWAEGAHVGEQLLALERELFGSEHEYVLRTLDAVAGFYEAAYDFAPAIKWRRQALPITEKLYLQGDWRITNARISVAEAEAGTKLIPEQVRSLRGSDELYARGLEHYRNERYTEAESLARQSAAIRKTILGPRHRTHISALVLVAAALGQDQNDPHSRPVLQQIVDLRLKLLGEDHPETAHAISDLALNYGEAEVYETARPLQQRAFDSYRKCLGEEDPEFATAALSLGTICKYQGDLDQAEKLYSQALAIRQKVLGTEDLDTVDAMDHLGCAYKEAGNFRAAERLFREAVKLRLKLSGVEDAGTTDSLNNLGMICEGQGKYAEAEKVFRLVLEVRRKTLGSIDADTAISMNNLAEVYRATGRYKAAEPLYLEALEANRQSLGLERGEVAANLDNLANLYAVMRENAKAKQFAVQALALRQRIWGENHEETAHSLNGMGWIYHTLGDLSQAEAYYQQAAAIFARTRGEQSAELATALSNLSTLYMAMRDYGKAEATQRRVLEIRQKLLGEEHPDVAMAWSNLASAYSGLDELAKAEEYQRKALALFEKTLGPDHPYTITALSNVSSGCLEREDYETAESLLITAWERQKKTLGEDHPDTLDTAGHVGYVYSLQGRYQQAEPLLQQAVASLRSTFGDQHSHLALHLTRLAMVYQGLDEPATAERHAHEAVSIQLRHLENTFSAQSERQKLLMRGDLRHTLDLWLTVAHDSHHPAEDLYGKLLAWKGVVFASESGLRARRDDPETAALFTEYQEVSRRLSTAALALPRNFDERKLRDRQLQELTDEKEAIEQKLSRLDAGFRQHQQEQRLTPAELQNLLPPDVVLVDFFEYTDIRPKPDNPGRTNKERRLIAFVVRRGQPLAEVELGPAEPIAAQIERWRTCFGSWIGPADEDPGLALRRTVWEPIAAKLGDAQTVLISPDGAVSQLPFAALPGDKRDEFLLHKYAIATIPVPQLMPHLLADSARSATDALPPSLLALGGVDYGSSPGKADENAANRSLDAETRAASLAGFSPLPGTLNEVKSVDERFHKRYQNGKSEMLDRARATEAAFRELAPKYRWLHLSTHGFFAPDKLKNALDRGGVPGEESAFGRSGVAAYHPGLLSGLAMTGANSKSRPGEDDGILTALEVASLDLSRTDVVVLSACETGLGRVAQGEGVLGLQRAFQVSGAKTVVASLWSVPDKATMRLMQRFYANLWDRNMSKLEALREAQLWLLSAPENQLLLTAEERAAAGNPKYLPPQAWAAFVLSGDWR